MRRASVSPSRVVTRMTIHVGVAVLALASMGCGKHYLTQYEFSQKTVALVFIEPPQPELLHGWYNLDVGYDNAVQTVVGAGAKVAKEVEARRASARLDSAAVRVDIDALLAQRTLERASRYLGTRIVESPDDADFVVELNMRAFGIDARSNHATYLYTRAEAVILERGTGREIWSEDVRGSDRLTPYVVGTANVPSAIFTAATLHTVTVEEFQEALEQLVALTADAIVGELRGDLRETRDRE
jgi:hypothetical protein